jgi:P22 coat protein - gene protein 5
MGKFNRNRSLKSYFANDNDAFIPQLWANEGLAILEETMVLGNLVYRDFENVIAKYGDVVNTRKPRTFTAYRKVDSDAVTVQNAISDNIAVPLNQHLHTSFMIMDGEESQSFKNLVDEYLRPGVISIASMVDKILSGQAIQFQSVAGGLGQLTSSNAASYLLQARQQLNVNKVPTDFNRHCVLTPYSETIMLSNTNFVDAHFVGDQGTALREASLGRKFGLNILMAQNQPHVPAGGTIVAGAINHTGGYPAGTTSFTVNGFSAAISAGTWITIAGDNTPLQVVSTTGGSTPTAIVTQQANLNAVGAAAVVNTYTPGAVNLSGGYAAGYTDYITITPPAVIPVVGQGVTFGSDNTDVYTICDVQSSGTSISLDRPLVNSIANAATVNMSPAGDYNFVFHRNALALVSRPLALPRAGMGALAANVTYNNLSMRVVMSYQGMNQGTLVTLDMLMGVAIFEKLAGVLLCG